MRYYLGHVYRTRLLPVALSDALCLATAAALTWQAVPPSATPLGFAAVAAPLAACALVMLAYAGAYQVSVAVSRRATLRTQAIAMGLLASLGTAAWLVWDPGGHWLEAGVHVLGVHFVLSTAARVALVSLYAHRGIEERLLLVGVSDLSRAIAATVHARRGLGIRLTGFLSDDPALEGAEVEGYPVLGRVEELEKVQERVRAQRVVVASKQRNESFPEAALLAAKLRGVRIEAGIAFYERVTGRIYMRDLRPSYLIFSDDLTPRRGYERAKRALDVLLAGAGLVLGSPVLLLAMLAVRLDSPGPVFYGQVRLGRWGHPYRLWKLRSMVPDADARGTLTTRPDDDRITRVGRILRKSRIDELPQLWNVLRGDMSLVGPRPERPEWAPSLSDRYAYFQVRNAAPPGITGWAQVCHGYVSDEIAFEEKLALDLYYLKYRSLAFDLLILARTLKTIVLLRGL